MTTAVEFFNLFFTVDLMNRIVNHTNSYAFQHITTHQAYSEKDGFWLETNADEMKRLIAILIYFGLIRVSDTVDNCNGLWGKAFMQRNRFRALMAFLHVVTGNQCERARL